MDQNKEGTAVHVCFRKNWSVQKHDMSFGCFVSFSFPLMSSKANFRNRNKLSKKVISFCFHVRFVV